MIVLIVTNRKDLVKQKSTCPLGISDHDMIYAILSAGIPIDQPSIPSKLMESCVASNITNHMVTQNLLDNRQWAYRRGKSTEQLTERWREAVERKLFVGILFVDFTKASVAQYIATKAERPGNQRRYLAVVKELPHRTKTIRQNQWI